MSPVTLPGDLASPVAGPLLRRGCPVAVNGIAAGRVYLGESYGMAMLSDGFGPPCAWGFGLVALDLSDPAGMDRAARWRLEHEGGVCGDTAPRWERVPVNAGHYGREDGEWSGGYAWGLDGVAVLWTEPGELTDPAEALRAACLAAVGRTP